MVDIIIRAKNGYDLTNRCIQSIVENTPEDQYRIILVDDGSTLTYGQYELPGVDYLIRCDRAHGAVSATNRGLAIALQLDGDYVAVFDNDTEVPAGDVAWLERFVAELEQYPRTGAVGAVTNFAKPVQHCLYAPQTYTGDWQDERTGNGGQKDNPAVTEFVSFAVLLRKQAVRQVGFWDERYNPGNYEDTDYAVQLRLTGWDVRVARSVYIHHKGHQTFSADLKRLLEENGSKFLGKWGPGHLWDLGLVPDQFMRQVIMQRKGVA